MPPRNQQGLLLWLILFLAYISSSSSILWVSDKPPENACSHASNNSTRSMCDDDDDAPILERRMMQYCFLVLLPLLGCCCMTYIIREGAARWRVIRWELLQREDVEEVLQDVKDKHYVSREGCYRAELCPICRKHFLEAREGGGNVDKSNSSSKSDIMEVAASESTPLFEKERVGADGTSLVSLRCGHEFHNACILNWMATQRQNCDQCRCPVCMQGI